MTASETENYLKDLSAEDFAHFIQQNIHRPNFCMKWASRYGYKDIVENMMKLGATCYFMSMAFAVTGGHKVIIQLLMPHCYNDCDMVGFLAVVAVRSLLSECMGLDVEKTLTLLTTCFSVAVAKAAEKGDGDIILKMKNGEGGGSYMAWAAWGGHPDIVEDQLKLGVQDYDLTIEAASSRGYTDIVKMVEQWRAAH